MKGVRALGPIASPRPMNPASTVYPEWPSWAAYMPRLRDRQGRELIGRARRQARLRWAAQGRL